MMKKVVVDASVFLAVLNQELPGDVLEVWGEHAVYSAVNVSEIVSVLLRKGVPLLETKKIVSALITSIIPFDGEIAMKAGELTPQAMPLGLSLGDRACLATALVMGYEVITADHAWSKLEVKGILIHQVR